MGDLIGSILKEVPWLRSFLAWSIAILAVFLVVTVPAYFILWPFFARARKQLAEFVTALGETLRTAQERRDERLNEAADDFSGDGGLWRIAPGARGRWSALVSSVLRRLKRLRKPLAKAAKALGSLSRNIPRVQQILQGAEIGEARALPDLGQADEVAESAATLRVSSMKLIMAAVILLGLMLVNTGMLSQILRDLGVIPSASNFAGIPLAYVFAFILTLVEAGLGIAHGAVRSDNPEKLSLWPAVMILFAVVLACVEGFFYSRIAPTKGTFSLPFTGAEMKQSDLFFLWGFVLVMTLFSLGRIGFENFAAVLRGSPSGVLRREIRNLRKQYEAYIAAFRKSEEALKAARAAAVDADRVIQGPAANAGSVQEMLGEVRQTVGSLSDQPPSWAARQEQAKLSQSEVHRLAQAAGLWSTFATFWITVMAVTGLTCFGAFYPAFEPLLLWTMAVGQALIFFAAGFLLGVGDTVVQEGEGRKVVSPPNFSRVAGFVLGGLLIVTYVALFFTLAKATGLRAIWGSDLLVGLFLIAAGHQLGPLLNVVRLWLRRVWNLVLLVLEAAWLGFMRLLHILVIVLEYASYLLAAPLDKVLSGRRPPPGGQPLSAVSARAGAAGPGAPSPTGFH